MSEIESVAKIILRPKYISCINAYAEKGDIKAAAK
jgi:hypothetical protein